LELSVSCQYGSRDLNMACQIKFRIICQLSISMSESKHDLSVKIWNHLSVVSKDVEIQKLFVSWIWNHLSVELLSSKLSCQIKFGIICQFWIRMLRSKYDLSVKIWNHLSVVSKDAEIKTWFGQLKFGIICQVSGQ